MQRVRIGLTGLAFVFLLVLLGSVFGNASDEEPITVNSLERQVASGEPENMIEPQPKEPLAELGVAPGNAESNSSGGASNTAVPVE